MCPKIVDKDAKRTEILIAAMEVIAAKGFSQTKMSDIAKNANIGKGTIYEYFKSKDEILVFSFKHYMEQIENITFEKLKTISHPTEKICAIFTAFIDFFNTTSSDYFEIITEFWAESIRNHDSERNRLISFKDIYEEYRTVIGDIINDGKKIGIYKDIDSRTAASLLLGTIDGIYFQWLMDRDSIDLEKATDLMVSIFIEGIGNK